MPERLIPTLLIAAVLALLFFLMWRGWRARRRRDATLAPYPVPEDALPASLRAQTLYVATTRHGEPLERLAIAGLGFRSRAELAVAADGVTIGIRGEAPVFVPRAAIRGIRPATWTIDRVVEGDGLLRLSWLLGVRADPSKASGEQTVDSYFRVTDPADRGRVIDAINDISPARAGAGTESEA
ncbi:PH-like domain-containing protein [Luethyella okanaganae]|uniref:PH domain-containing protein n=1 Tax=Luethyella okanaganae TaxID=69372 RepID=A0ABW1VF21_9MICO